MCWSLQASLAGAALAHGGAATAFLRNATPRDRWNALFLFVVGSMQWIDAALWWIESEEGLARCSYRNHLVAKAGNWIIMLEPMSQLLGRHLYVEPASLREGAAYLCLFVALPLLSAMVFTSDECRASGCCGRLSPGGHIMYTTGTDAQGAGACYRKHIFFGELQHEIPIALRVFFLLGMLYPLLCMRPRLSGLVCGALLTATWLVGLATDGHASMWCLAASGMGLWLVLDSYCFPPPQPQLRGPVTVSKLHDTAVLVGRAKSSAQRRA